jgi:murein DD-endopeptidase MepM/ murein hydrolase activator NlpD
LLGDLPQFTRWPLGKEKFWISSFFGMRYDRARGRKFHYGLDLAARKGTRVHTVAGGVVKEAGSFAGYGNMVLVQHTHRYKTRYAHLNTILVKVGQKIAQGDLIGTVGNTGFVVRSGGGDASHLHFEVYDGKKAVNPLKFLPKRRLNILK